MTEIDTLTAESVNRRRNAPEVADRVMFSVKSLYGLSRESIDMPLNQEESIDSGQVCVTIDPEADEASNIGIIDYNTGTLKVRYGVHAVFPGLFQLVVQEKLDPSLLAPVRAVATDECSLADDVSGWEALGCLEFLPGSIWAGAGGG